MDINVVERNLKTIDEYKEKLKEINSSVLDSLEKIFVILKTNNIDISSYKEMIDALHTKRETVTREYQESYNELRNYVELTKQNVKNLTEDLNKPSRILEDIIKEIL